jgi:Ca2+-binding RTX toxin-like protein
MADYAGTNKNDSVTGLENEANLFKEFGIGADNLFGGVLDDTFRLLVDQVMDKIDGGKGRDLIDYNGSDRALTIDLGGSSNTGSVMATFGTTVRTVASLTGIEDVIGSKFNDTIYGTIGRNTLNGNDGDDTIFGYDNDDTLIGGIGKDTLDGGSDRDTLIGGIGPDTLRGGTGEDTASYADSTTGIFVDLLTGTASGGTAAGDTFNSIEDLVGSAYFDTLKGDTWDNQIYAGDGGDMLYDQGGNDHVYGEKGDDTMIAGTGSDSFDGGEGIDTLSFVNAVNGLYISLGTTHAYAASTPAGAHALNAQGNGIAGTYDTVVNIENAVGSSHADRMFGSDGDNSLYGLGGDDEMDGGWGNDTMVPGTGNDRVRGGEGVDTISFVDRTVGVEVNLDIIGNQRSWDYQTGSRIESTADTLFGFENIAGSAYDDSLWGDDNANTIWGLSGKDYIEGKGGFDTLVGGGGDDFLVGGAGRDSLAGGTEADTFYFRNPAECSDPVSHLPDIVTDYQAGVDTLLFSSEGFGLGVFANPLNVTEGSHLVEGTSPAAKTADWAFLYNTSSHILSYDQDGSGSGAAVPIAVLANVGYLDDLIVA